MGSNRRQWWVSFASSIPAAVVRPLVSPTNLPSIHFIMKQRPTKIVKELFPRGIHILDTHILLGRSQGTRVPSGKNCCLLMAHSWVPPRELLLAERRCLTQSNCHSAKQVTQNYWSVCKYSPLSSLQSIPEGSPQSSLLGGWSPCCIAVQHLLPRSPAPLTAAEVSWPKAIPSEPSVCKHPS